VLRYDMRGYGRSEPVEGEYTNLQDLSALLDYLQLDQPLILMGCSMGGGLCMDFALTHPSKVKALIMVDSGPSGLQLDVPSSPKFAEVEKAFDVGDLNLVSELETQIWFDGVGRTPDQVDQPMRRLLYDMNLGALTYEVRKLGKRLPNMETSAAERLSELQIPVLVIVGDHDTPFTVAAADYMMEKLPSAEKAVIEDAAHLPNMEHPDEFQRIVMKFLNDSVH
jgi:pimeloyl-ACP methyl ester carboxylesterase